MMVVWTLAEPVTVWFVNFNTKNQLNLVKIYSAPSEPDTTFYQTESPDTHFSNRYSAELDYSVCSILLLYNTDDLKGFG